jgi:hypothetical protein
MWILFIFSSIGKSQQFLFSIDTLYNDYTGQISIKRIVDKPKNDTIEKFTFKSNPVAIVKDGNLLLKDLIITGDLEKNVANNLWTFNFRTTYLDQVALSKQKSLKLNYFLNGNEELFNFPLLDGAIDGRVIAKKTPFVDGVYGKISTTQIYNFKKDTLVGEISIIDQDLKFEGTLNESGFFDGPFYISYNSDSIKIDESRVYNNGFLLSIVKVNSDSKDTIEVVTYDKVYEDLLNLKNPSRTINYRISDDWFGVTFNHGYSDNDRRLSSQQRGNEILEKKIQFLNQTLAPFLHDKKIELKLTRKFEFVQSELEDSILYNLDFELDLIKVRVNDLLSKPNLILRKLNSPSLTNTHVKLMNLSTKVEKLIAVVDSIRGGEFKYISLTDYYKMGINELRPSDTLYYVFNKDTLYDVMSVGYEIDFKNNLIADFYQYTLGIQKLYENLAASIGKELENYESQERIDSLDRMIAATEEMVQQQFSQNEASLSLGDQFQLKLYTSLKEKFIDGLKNRYLNNKLEEIELMQTGSQLICFYNFLIDYGDKIRHTGGLKQHWNDSLFTTLIDNPFDTRKLESKILPGVQNSATILLNHYANQMLNAKSCDQLKNEIDKIYGLQERVEVLVKSYTNATVQQYDKVLRREKVPTRIERILKL